MKNLGKLKFFKKRLQFYMYLGGFVSLTLFALSLVGFVTSIQDLNQGLRVAQDQALFQSEKQDGAVYASQEIKQDPMTVILTQDDLIPEDGAWKIDEQGTLYNTNQKGQVLVYGDLYVHNQAVLGKEIRLLSSNHECNYENRGAIVYQNDSFWGCRSNGWVKLH